MQAYTIFSDFLGENGRAFFYRVTGVHAGREVSTSAVVSARSRALSDEELLTSVQEATFRYFWHYGHPVSGLAREGFGWGDTVTTGGSGFGSWSSWWASSGDSCPARGGGASLPHAGLLEDKATRYHGAWAHWLNGRTGQTIPFSKYDDGGDLVETSFLVQGLLTARQYFDRNTPAEAEIRLRATRLWESVEWDGIAGSRRATSSSGIGRRSLTGR